MSLFPLFFLFFWKLSFSFFANSEINSVDEEESIDSLDVFENFDDEEDILIRSKIFKLSNLFLLNPLTVNVPLSHRNQSIDLL